MKFLPSINTSAESPSLPTSLKPATHAPENDLGRLSYHSLATFLITEPTDNHIFQPDIPIQPERTLEFTDTRSDQRLPAPTRVRARRILFLALTPPTDLSHSKERSVQQQEKKKLLFHAVDYIDQHAAQPTNKRRLLPDIQPKRPEQWDDEARKNRSMIGDDKHHLFLTLSNVGGASYRNPVFMLNVSRGVDHNGRWFYENIDDDSMHPLG